MKHSDTIKENMCVQIYTVIIHYYKWFWQNKAIWGYFPEMIIRGLGIGSIHVAWQPMALPESGSWETWKGKVTNEHLGKCVKACLIDIRFAKCQNAMETRQCKYHLSISLLFRWIRVWNVKFAHGMVIDITDSTVMCCSKMKGKAGWWQGNKKNKTQGGERKGEKCVVHVGKMIEIIFLI